MSERCPKCGAAVRLRATNYSVRVVYDCGSSDGIDNFDESVNCLRRQIAAANETIRGLREIVEGQECLCAAYRLGLVHTGGSALNKIAKGRAIVAAAAQAQAKEAKP